MINSGTSDEPRINVEAMTKVSNAIGALSIWINCCLELARLYPPKSAPVKPEVISKTPKKTPKKSK
jgi:hypothetical protein